MNEFKRILVISRMTQYCKKAVQYGLSMAKKNNAELYVFHAVQNPFGLKGWSFGVMFPVEEEYQKLLEKRKEELDALIESESGEEVSATTLIKEGEPTEEIFKTVKEKNIDLVIMQAHEEGKLEHFLFSRSNEELIRKMPCSILLLKKEPEPA